MQDSTDGKALSLIQELDFSGARDVWREAAEKENSKTLFYKKNLALLDLEFNLQIQSGEQCFRVDVLI